MHPGVDKGPVSRTSGSISMVKPPLTACPATVWAMLATGNLAPVGAKGMSLKNYMK